MRRMLFAIILISTILLGANAIACTTWLYFSQTQGWWIWEIASALLTISFIPITLLGMNQSPLWLRLIYTLSAIWVAVINYCFFAAIFCWGTVGITKLLKWDINSTHIAEFHFSSALLIVVYGLLNAARIRVKHIKVKLPHLPPSWQGKQVALLTDLHLGHVSGPFFLQRILKILTRHHPEAVLISGDLFDGSTAKLDYWVEKWKDFKAPHGIYYITGNHDEFEDRKKVLDAVRNVGIQVLHNEKVLLHDHLQLIGVHDAETREEKSFREILENVQIDRQKASILLVHRPENLSAAEEAGIHLQLSGHTHNGQFWPWNWVVSGVYGRFAYGLNRLQTLQVYTSSGVGTWGPPIRVGTSSEIVLIQLEADES